MLDRYGPRSHQGHLIRFQYDQRLLAEIALIRVLWLEGETDVALDLIEDLLTRARQLNHGPTYANILAEAACPVALQAGDFVRAERYLSLLRAETVARSMDVWRTYADAFEGELLIRRGRAESGVALLQGAIATLRTGGFVLYDTAFRGVLATGLDALGKTDEAAAEITEALEQCARTGEAWCLPELQRVRAEQLIRQGNSLGEALLAEALAKARRQGARAWEARIAQSMAQLLPSRPGNPAL
jgi:hypothetical protein